MARAVIRLAALGMAQALAARSAPVRAEQPGPAAESCRITVTALAFGVYDPQSPRPSDSAAAVTIACEGTGVGPRGVTLGASSGNAPRAADRVLRAGAQGLSYNLYSDPGRQQIWGDGSDGHPPITVPITAPITGPSAPVRIDIYGRIPAGQAVAPADYTDTILVTVVF